MIETQLQDRYLIRFLCDKSHGLNYKEIKANIVSDNLFVKSDLQDFLRDTTLNAENYKKLVRIYANDENKLITEFIDALAERMRDMANMAIFINNTKTFTFKGLKFNLFYPSGGEFDGDKLFNENIFSVVQECAYKYQHEGKIIYTFRPDITFFVNGIYLGYSELKSTYNNQTASKHGRGKVIQDYENAVLAYLKFVGENDLSQSVRKDFLKIFEKAIHITATDLENTYVIRTIANHFDEIKKLSEEYGDFDEYKKKALNDFKSYPVLNREADKLERFEEVFKTLYAKEMIEKEILYYNFIEREVIKTGNNKDFKNEKGKLISPRPKQKFGTDKIIRKIDEFLDHESDDDYFINKLAAELDKKGVGEARKQELIDKRLKYQNNKNIYSLLLQYAAGFGKSNIIGWSTLQLKDLKRNGDYVYDKVMIIVDRLQLRDQITDKMLNMNLNKAMFIEAENKQSFLNALKSDTRIVIVNLQKFGTVKQILDESVLAKLSKLRIAFLIDEIHRSNDGVQNEEMLSIFDEIQSQFDKNKYNTTKQKKNLIVGFTATPTDHTLARFGEYNKYAEAEKLWIPFDSYTMKEAIKDGYILNPLNGIVAISAKMFFEEPEDLLTGFEGDSGYEEMPDDVDTGTDDEGRKYAVRKRGIYENEERIDAISKFIVDRLVTTVYHNIRGKAKAMLAVTSIKAAQKYKRHIDKLYKETVKEKKYQRFEEAPVYIVYSASQDTQDAKNLNDGATEDKVLQNFKLAKNGLIIVVDKLQTGFDEPRLHTLFLDKEIKGINAIQTISRVNRTTKYKNDCKILDFSYRNVNVQNIKKAYEHFSNVTVSDFDPLGDEKRLADIFQGLKKSTIAETYFKRFAAEFSKKGESDTEAILKIQVGFSDYIKGSPKEAKELKQKVNSYFRILNLIEYVIDFDWKFIDKAWLDFWKRFNNEYNSINKSDDIVDDVMIYFDNQIGIIEPHQPNDTQKKKGKLGKTNGKTSENGKYKFDIRAVIEKLNEDQEEIEKLIKDFQEKVEKLFAFIALPGNGNRLIAKMKSAGSSFSEDEIYNDFTTLYKKFVRRNKESLGEMFINETKDCIHKLCDDFEKSIL
jgi:type I restriction enzyme R subunit